MTQNYNSGIEERAIPRKTLLLCLEEREKAVKLKNTGAKCDGVGYNNNHVRIDEQEFLVLKHNRNWG